MPFTTTGALLPREFPGRGVQGFGWGRGSSLVLHK